MPPRTMCASAKPLTLNSLRASEKFFLENLSSEQALCSARCRGGAQRRAGQWASGVRFSGFSLRRGHSPIMASVTDCPCGENQDMDGLMIQCEECDVWQHGDCVGLFHKDATPEHYFCEKCRPQHRIHQNARQRRPEVVMARQARIARARARQRLERQFVRRPKKKSKQRRGNDGSRGSDGGAGSSVREQRKIERVMEAFKKIEDKGSKGRPPGAGGAADRKRRPRARRSKRKAEEGSISSGPSGIALVAKSVARSPMYFGRKSWLLQMHREDQLRRSLPGMERLADSTLPVSKRVLATYHERVARGAESATAPMQTTHTSSSSFEKQKQQQQQQPSEQQPQPPQQAAPAAPRPATNNGAAPMQLDVNSKPMTSPDPESRRPPAQGEAARPGTVGPPAEWRHSNGHVGVDPSGAAGNNSAMTSGVSAGGAAAMQVTPA